MDISDQAHYFLNFIQFKVKLAVKFVNCVLNRFNLLPVLFLVTVEIIIRDNPGEKLFFGNVAFFLNGGLLTVKGFLFFVDFTLSFFVDFFHPANHVADEFLGELDGFKFVSHLFFQVPDIHVFIIAFNSVAGTVAVIIRLAFLGVVLGGVTLAALGAKNKAPKDKVVFTPSAGITVVLSHYGLGLLKS